MSVLPDRIVQRFEAVRQTLVDSGALPSNAMQLACPDTPEAIVSRLLRAGADAESVTLALSEAFSMPVYSENLHGSLDYAADGAAALGRRAIVRDRPVRLPTPDPQSATGTAEGCPESAPRRNRADPDPAQRSPRKGPRPVPVPGSGAGSARMAHARHRPPGQRPSHRATRQRGRGNQDAPKRPAPDPARGTHGDVGKMQLPPDLQYPADPVREPARGLQHAEGRQPGGVPEGTGLLHPGQHVPGHHRPQDLGLVHGCASRPATSVRCKPWTNWPWGPPSSSRCDGSSP